MLIALNSKIVELSTIERILYVNIEINDSSSKMCLLSRANIVSIGGSYGLNEYIFLSRIVSSS